MASALVITSLLSSVSAFTLKEQTYLSDLKPVTSTIGWGSLGYDKSVGGNPITLLDENGAKVVYEKGIGTHCNSVIVYDISEYTSKGYNVFDCYVGFDAECLPDIGAGVFSVIVDGKSVVNTGEVKTTDAAKRITVDIAGAKELKLSATCNSNSFTHADWANAIIGKSDDIEFPTSEFVLERDGASWLNKGDTVDFTTSAVYDDGLVNIEKTANVTYSSSDTSVATVDETTGVVTAVSSGSAVITATYDYDTVKGSKKATVYVAGDGILLSSPDGKIKSEIVLTANGSLKYAVAYGAEVVINQSDMGIDTSIGNFTNGLTYVGRNTEKVEETYYMHSGKAEYYNENALETTIEYKKGGKTLKLIVNIANDSFAYRYVINGETSFTANGETSSFAIPDGSTVYSADYESFYENNYDETASELLNGNKGMCLLYETSEGTLVLLNEADMSNNYCGSALNISNGVARVDTVDDRISVTGDFETPWRVAVIGDAAAIAECQTFENLSDPSVVNDADDWVISKITSWTWLTSRINNDPEEFKKYIDQSVDMGWGYLLMDDGWAKFDETETIIIPEWLDEVVKYGEERGIGILAWLDNKYVNTKAKAETNLSILAENGIKGIKVDFFNSESQGTIQNMIRISEICAEKHLLVNMHGANKPTGERRTYPNVITREGVFGCEYGGGTNAFDNVLLALARGAVGPADYTPQLLAADGQYTTNHSSAMPIISESGLMCISSYPEDFAKSVLTAWFTDMPSRWHETKLIDTDLGKNITLARRYEDRWYVSAITTNKVDLSVDLSFLDEGVAYLATIFYDTDDVNTSGVRYELVTAKSKINVALAENGGANIRLDKKYTLPTDMKLSKTEVTVPSGLTATVDATLVGAENVDAVVFTAADKSVVKVTSNGKTAILKGLLPGTTTVTASVKIGDTVITKEIAVTVQGKEIYGDNIAIGKDVISDSETSGMEAALINDGNNETRWQSTASVEAGTTAYVGFDLKNSTSFNTAFIYWESARASTSGYTIQVSDDGKNWTDVKIAVTRDVDANDITFDIVNFDTVSARYVRIHITSMEGKYTNPSIWEFELYNVGNENPVKPDVYDLGDVNNDGKINSTDFMRIRNHFLGTYNLTGPALAAADVNKDGKINSTDFMRVRKHFLGTFDLYA